MEGTNHQDLYYSKHRARISMESTGKISMTIDLNKTTAN